MRFSQISQRKYLSVAKLSAAFPLFYAAAYLWTSTSSSTSIASSTIFSTNQRPGNRWQTYTETDRHFEILVQGSLRERWTISSGFTFRYFIYMRILGVLGHANFAEFGKHNIWTQMGGQSFMNAWGQADKYREVQGDMYTKVQSSKHKQMHTYIIEKGKKTYKNAAKQTRQHARIIFHQKSSSTEGRLPPQVIFHQS